MNAKHFFITISTLLLLNVSLTTRAFSQDTDAAKMKASREEMAQIHIKMAECLRSDKSVEACHTEMRSSCQSMEMDCPMMGKGMGMGMGKGMGKGTGKTIEKTKK